MKNNWNMKKKKLAITEGCAKNSHQAVVHEDRSLGDAAKHEHLSVVVNRGVPLPCHPNVVLPTQTRRKAYWHFCNYDQSTVVR